MVRHIIVLLCHVCGIYVFVSSCKCYSRLVNVCHGFVPSWFWYFCHSNAFHAHACHAIVCHAIVTSCKCLSCNRGHVNERPTSASSCVPRWLPFSDLKDLFYLVTIAVGWFPELSLSLFSGTSEMERNIPAKDIYCRPLHVNHKLRVEGRHCWKDFPFSRLIKRRALYCSTHQLMIMVIVCNY